MRSVRLSHGGETVEVRIEGGVARIGGRTVAFEVLPPCAGTSELRIGAETHRIAASSDGDRVFVWCDGRVYAFERPRGPGRGPGAEQTGDLAAPMPGRVGKVLVEAGETVERGRVLMVLEAMKMEHSIEAPRDGIVARILVREGDLVEAGVELAEVRGAGGTRQAGDAGDGGGDNA